MLGNLDHPWSKNTLRAIERRKCLRKLRHMAAYGRILLYQDNLMSGICNVEACLDTCNTTSNYQRSLRDRHLYCIQRLVIFHLFNQYPYEVYGLFSGSLSFFMNP